MYQAIVIDDEKWVVKSLIATIKNQDYFEITTEFYDGLSGLEYIRIHQPALAFVDVRLPGMGGLEILQAAHAEGLSTLFIMISGHAEFYICSESNVSQCDRILSKAIFQK